MQERDRFDPGFSERLPDICWSVRSEDGALICIQKGMDACCVSEESRDDPRLNRHLADYFNREMGVSQAQERAMLGGLQSGWDSPAASPGAYLRESQREGEMTLG